MADDGLERIVGVVGAASNFDHDTISFKLVTTSLLLVSQCSSVATTNAPGATATIIANAARQSRRQFAQAALVHSRPHGGPKPNAPCCAR
jgi:hypothetical protein